MARLDDWQRLLEGNFRSLAESRSGGAPVFVLEHGLEVELNTLSAELTAELKLHGRPNVLHWLPWLVFAAECGYEYSGGEFWHTFESRLPGWETYGNRHLIRAWFRRFRQTFSGVKPSGRWASHFSIIAWPITHAVLPKDLQFQFARAIYESRFRLPELGDDVAAIGALLHRQSWLSTSRFKEFCEQEHLVGQIALALLGTTGASEPTLLAPATVRRIVADLESAHVAKEWLRDTRAHVQRVKGALKKPKNGARTSAPVPRIESLNLQPTLRLVRGIDSWAVSVQVPSFAPAANSNEAIRSFLRGTRFQLAGGQLTWMPGEKLLRPSFHHQLSQWPAEGKSIVNFKSPTPADFEVAALSLSQGPIWPCRIHRGHAIEILGRQVRPGQEYVLLVRLGYSVPNSPLLEACKVSCAGVAAFQLRIPKSVDGAVQRLIASLGLQLCQTLRIWPAGLAARGWDGEGTTEWLTTELPSFGIAHDYPLDAISMSVDGGAEQVVSRANASLPLFVQLGELEPGTHFLRVRAKSSDGRRTPDGLVQLVVREPLPWSQSLAERGGFTVYADPALPSLESLEDGSLKLTIHGPDGRSVGVQLVCGNGEPSVVDLGKFDIPVRVPDLWGRLSTDAQAEVNASAVVTVVVADDDLGRFTLRLERESLPLRWHVRRTQGELRVRLIDESGSPSPPLCLQASLEEPGTLLDVPYETCKEGFAVSAPGSMYFAASKEKLDVVLASQVSGEMKSFADLRVDSRFYGFGSPESIAEDIKCMDVWSRARPVGQLALVRRDKVVHEMERRLTEQTCGVAWSKAEALFDSSLKDRASEDALGNCVTTDRAKQPAVSKILFSREEARRLDAPSRARWLNSVLCAFKVYDNPELVTLALKYAASPPSFIRASKDPSADVTLLTLHGMVARSARLLFVLLRDAEWEW